MAVKAAFRYKPDTYRSGLETIVENFDPAAGTGTLVLPCQMVIYDDTKVTGANYVPGDPSSERNINVLYEDVIRLDIAATAALSQAAMQTAISDALAQWGNSVKPSATALGKIVLAAKRAAPQLLV